LHGDYFNTGGAQAGARCGGLLRMFLQEHSGGLGLFS
jgi:hypothetical protein